eukprot:scaffold189870_cov53-Attheya_sp.AAC.1
MKLLSPCCWWHRPLVEYLVETKNPRSSKALHPSHRNTYFWRYDGGGPSCRRRTQQNMANNEARMLQAPPLPATYSYNPSLSNVYWAEFTLEDFSEALQCEDIPSDARPIHGASTWRQLRQTYEDVIGPRRSSIGQTMSDLETNEKEKGQIEMPASQDANNLYAGNVPGKGRGMIASRDIKAGENIWSDVYMGE